MFKRRDVVAGGALTLLWGACGCRGAAATGRRRYGCCLVGEEARTLLAASGEPRTFGLGGAPPPLPGGSGDREFDRALAQTLNDISRLFGVLPAFRYCDDRAGENAYATNISHDGRADGTVLFGIRLLRRIRAEQEHPGVAIAGVCAHEFAHIVQFKYGLERVLEAGQRTGKRVELQADFLAGYFAGRRRLEQPGYPAAAVAMSLSENGDFDVHGRDHHGTPQERGAAVVRGFEVAARERRSAAEAIQISVAYALRA